MSQVVNRNDIISKVSGATKVQIRQIMNMYIEDCITNIVNGYKIVLPNNFQIQCVLEKLKPGQQPYYTKKSMFHSPNPERALNPNTPNHYLHIRLDGNVADFFAVKFKAGEKLARACSTACTNGKIYAKA